MVPAVFLSCRIARLMDIRSPAFDWTGKMAAKKDVLQVAPALYRH
jgi:hypothetical protein